jgi:hypothetical protein
MTVYGDEETIPAVIWDGSDGAHSGPKADDEARLPREMNGSENQT